LLCLLETDPRRAGRSLEKYHLEAPRKARRRARFGTEKAPQVIGPGPRAWHGASANCSAPRAGRLVAGDVLEASEPSSPSSGSSDAHSGPVHLAPLIETITRPLPPECSKQYPSPLEGLRPISGPLDLEVQLRTVSRLLCVSPQSSAIHLGTEFRSFSREAFRIWRFV